MNKNKEKGFLKRYDKFKNNNMPTPFWDDERQILEYVSYDSELDYFNKNLKAIDFDRRLNVDNNLVTALGGLADASFYYPYTCGYFTYENDNKDNVIFIVGHTHSHSFEEVVKNLYDFPESFSISKDEERFFSSQELSYLRRVQKYLLFLGVQDLDSIKTSVKRYRNSKQKKYGIANIHTYDDKTINSFLSGKRNFVVIIPINIDIYKEYEEYSEHDRKELVADKNDNIRMFIEFTHSEIKRYKDIKKVYRSKELKDNDKIVAMYFKILETF